MSEIDFRISPLPILAVLVYGTVLLGWIGSVQHYELLNLVLPLWAIFGLAWLLYSWKRAVGRWSTVVGVIVAIQLVGGRLNVPGFQVLMTIPIALAAALISLPAVMATAAGETVFLLLLQRGSTSVGSSDVTVPLIAIWAMAGIMYAIHRPMSEVVQWSWAYFGRAQVLLEKARDRQAQLRQALDDLAYANRQLSLFTDKVDMLRLAAEEAEKSKSAFVAAVSHEFRTPLNMIIGLTDLLLVKPEVFGEHIPTKLAEHLEIVHRNCEHLSSMIDDVLDLSQIEAGRMAMRRQWVDLAKIVDKAADIVRPLIEKKGLELLIEIPSDLPEIYCDRTRIFQVVVNLLSNAARFTQVGRIDVKVSPSEQDIAVSVSDTGPGIPAEDAENIFEPFRRSTSRAFQDKEGSGLGLSISKEFVKMHGGQMWLESQMGVGSTFFFRLPISKPIEPTSLPTRWLVEDWVERIPRADLPHVRLEHRVVVCDNTEELYPLFARYADQTAYVETSSLEEAVHEVERCPAHAVVLNSFSPDHLLTLAQRARVEIPDTPIIGCCVPPKIDRGSALGVKDYLVKPVTSAGLQKAIQALEDPVNRVLVVDDESNALQLFTLLLHAIDGDLEVTTASSGKEALRMLRDQRPDLVLLDVIMPHMDGWQVLDIKNGDDTIKDIPVIMVSAQDAREKPIESAMLLATMGEGLSFSKVLRGSQALAVLLLSPD